MKAKYQLKLNHLGKRSKKKQSYQILNTFEQLIEYFINNYFDTIPGYKTIFFVSVFLDHLERTKIESSKGVKNIMVCFVNLPFGNCFMNVFSATKVFQF